MHKFVALAAAVGLLCTGTATAIAADTVAKVTCADGTIEHSKGECSAHRGVQAAKDTSTPIDTTKGLTPPKKTATTSSSKTPTSSTSKSAKKKTASMASSSPTAKCNDGAMYFSRERRGACASHGGVKKWYGW